MSIQIGDTVEVRGDDFFADHPTEHRFLKKGDKIVVDAIDGDYVWYFVNRLRCFQRKVDVEKIPSNHVEIKFR
jgi:hypothetical protein